MVWGTICIFFIRVILIHFYPKLSKFIGVLSLFSEKSCKSAKRDIKWRLKEMKFEDQSFLEGFWRQYKMKKIHFKVQGILRWKNNRKGGEKLQNSHWRHCLIRPVHGTMHPCVSDNIPCCPKCPCTSLNASHACVSAEVPFACFLSCCFVENHVFFLLTSK